ncbi:hypothetical protein JCM8547_004627 [Rhodosporidiobolus lusitaniae]
MQSYLEGLSGAYGAVGLYGAVQRFLVGVVPLAASASFLTDAPFGRFLSKDAWKVKGQSWRVNGRFGWLFMEIVSPLSLLYFLSVPPTTTPFSFPAPSFSRIYTTLSSLPPARLVLVAAYLVHYANRSILSELRNPGRAPMHIIIPFLSAVYNACNGGTIGMYLGGGAAGMKSSNFGLKSDAWARPLFAAGLALWLAGFASNAWHDNVFFRIKREKRAEREEKAKKAAKVDGQSKPRAPSFSDPKDRYAIPQGGLYRFISHPSYISEWIEWTGFWLSTLALASPPFPPSQSSPSLLSFPSPIRPLQQWYLQPPVLFVALEVAAMLPRARSGHAWYKETFGKEWEKKGAKWIVLLGVY